MAEDNSKASAVADRLEVLAAQALEAFESIAGAAQAGLHQNSPGIDSFASVNQATAEKLMRSLRDVQQGREIDCRKLMRQPAIARIVIADEDDNREELYVCPSGVVGPVGVKLCSYLSPKGQLASYGIGDERRIKLPSGFRQFELLEKATFMPLVLGGEWDSRPAVVHSPDGPPLTIKSLRDLLAKFEVSEDELELLERHLAAFDASDLVVEGLRHSTITAMQLRIQPVLDGFQSEIFRLPIDSRLVILGPPGSGKTTTLVKRLRMKLDFAFLDEEERDLVDERGVGGLDHQNSWLMFTPTDLLKKYVQEAFNREDVPAPDERIQTWEDYRRAVARRNLPVLRSAMGKGLVMKSGLAALKPETVGNQIEWFEAFSEFQQDLFLKDLAAEGARLMASRDTNLSALGLEIEAAVLRNAGRPLRFLLELANLLESLQRFAAASRDETRLELRRLLALEVKRDGDFLESLARFLGTLAADADDDFDDPDGEDDEEEAVPSSGLRAADAAFVRALRAKAIAEATRRASSRTSRSAHILGWLEARGVVLPALSEIGDKLVIQRALGRIVKAPSDFITKVPARYRKFRREVSAEGQWYAMPVSTNEADPLEIDLILLAMLRSAREMRGDAVMMRRMGERVPPILDTVAGLWRNQILVDEATDFSPVQLACMAALADPKTDSFFAVGDFNQRLTIWGTRSRGDLEWLFRDIQVREIDTVYRQSRKLIEFAASLASPGGGGSAGRLPAFTENEGVKPVFGKGLRDRKRLAMWLAHRIREIEVFAEQLPSIAVLVNRADELEPLAEALNDALLGQNIHAVACPKGQAIGPENDVRVFEVQHIKGLEFEAVFFVDIDELARNTGALFERYIFVGATRAATFLGLTCSGEDLPPELVSVAAQLGDAW